MYALARQSGIPNQSISRIERGMQEPGWETVLKLAQALGVSVAAFEVNEPTSEPAANPDAGQPDAPVLPEQPHIARGKYK